MILQIPGKWFQRKTSQSPESQMLPAIVFMDYIDIAGETVDNIGDINDNDE